MKIKGLKEAIARAGYDAKGRRCTWNHRIIKRYSAHGEWYELTEVHYRDGKPHLYAVDMRTPSAHDEDGDPVASLRDTLSKMLLALDKPILDEKLDFADEDAR
jgi:hypothetical protein